MSIEKTYIISYIKNDEKRNHIKSILNQLSINNYEFIYGIDIHISDAYKITIYDEKDGNNFIIENDNADTYASHAISCGIAHFTALQHAYYSNFNNCLIIEDDVLLYENIDYVKYVLSNFPQDADIIQYGYILFDEDINNKYDNYYNVGQWYPGAQSYAVCNKTSIKQLIDNYLKMFYEADNYNLYSNMKIYNTNIPIFIDPVHIGYNIDIKKYR